MSKQVIIKLSDRIPHVADELVSTKELVKRPGVLITFHCEHDKDTGTYLTYLVLSNDEDDDDTGLKIELDTVVTPSFLSDRFLVPLSCLTEGVTSIEQAIIQGLCETATSVRFTRLRYNKEITILVNALGQDFGANTMYAEVQKYFTYDE